MIRRILRLLLCIIRRIQINKNAIVGSDFSISFRTKCVSDNREKIHIGSNCEIIDSRLQVTGDGYIEIGNNTTMRYNSKISSTCGVIVGSCVIISNNVRIYDHNSHPTNPVTREEMCIKGFHGKEWLPIYADKAVVKIEDNVWIGEYSVILKGVSIGRGSIIGCNSVVTKDVPPYSIAAGNPAIIVKKLKVTSDEQD